MDIKIDPKSALERIDRHIVSGYEKKDVVADEFAANDHQISEELLEKWGILKRDWIVGTIEALEGVFVSEAPLYNFRDAHASFGVSTNPRYTGVLGDFDAKIGKLNEYYQFIQVNFDVKAVQITVSGTQNRVNVNSEDSSTNIIDQSINTDIEELERLVNDEYADEDKDEIVGDIQEVKELSKKPESNQKAILGKLGTILAKTAQVSTIAPVVLKLLNYFSNLGG